jgi:Arc/MetJ family transcription regulator
MRTTVIIDELLLKRLLQVGGFKTMREAIQAAIERFIENAEREELVKMAGSVAFEKDHLHALRGLEKEEME